MANTLKPASLDCYTYAGRLRLIKQLSTYLPGSNGQPRMADDTALTIGKCQLMLSEWQLKFTISQHHLMYVNYSFQTVVDSMETQRQCFDLGNKRFSH
jgi:hypothetical protein